MIGFQIWNNTLVQFKHQVLGLPLGKKQDFSVPKLVREKELFFAFMKGIFDTDGSIYVENKRGKPYPRIDIKTTSESFCLEAVKLLNRYGIRATYYEYNREKYGWSNLYSIIVRGFPTLALWIKYIGSGNPKHIWKLEKIKKMGPP